MDLFTDIFTGLEAHHDELAILRRIQDPAERRVLLRCLFDAADVAFHSFLHSTLDFVGATVLSFCVSNSAWRHLFIRQQTSVINAIRAHLAFGIVAPVGRNGVEQLIDVIADSGDQRVPEVARLGAQLGTLKTQILASAKLCPCATAAKGLRSATPEVPFLQMPWILNALDLI
ncbi:MAG: hypothetical protein ABSA62_15895 [Methyloceanibacter sp.]